MEEFNCAGWLGEIGDWGRLLHCCVRGRGEGVELGTNLKG